MAAIIDKVISVAKNEVGYLEKKSNKNLDSKTKNAGSANYTKYGKWIGANGDYWCASFLSWCFNEAYGKDKGKSLLCGGYSAACETLRNQFKNKKKYYTSNPKKGDVIFFKGSRHSGANHIGIVISVNGSTITTVEGNTSGASGVVDNGGGVAKKTYSVSYSKILGYGRPSYDKSSSSSTVKTVDVKDYKGCITASTLNIRKSYSTNSAVVGTYKKGKEITIKKEHGKWGQTDKGWICLDYVSKKSTTTVKPSSTFKSYKVKVTASSLRIRKSASTSSAQVGSYKKNTTVTIKAVKNGWGQTSKGWVCLKYTKKI